MKLGQALWPPLLLSILLHIGILGLSKATRMRSTPNLVSPATSSNQSPIDVSLSGPAQPGTKLTSPTLFKASAEPSSPSSAPATAASKSGDGAAEGELAGYAALVRERIGRSLQYPLRLQRRGIRGRVGLKLTLDPLGRVQAQEITQHPEGPGARELDELALAAVREAEPFPEPPPGLRNSGTIVLNLPVDFKLGR